MRSIWFGVALAVAACGGTPSKTRPAPAETAQSAPPPSAPPPSARTHASTLIDTVQGFSDAMCKCVDKPCADKIMADMVTWNETAGRLDPHDLVSEADARRISAVTETLTRCMTTAMMAGATPPP